MIEMDNESPKNQFITMQPAAAPRFPRSISTRRSLLTLTLTFAFTFTFTFATFARPDAQGNETAPTLKAPFASSVPSRRPPSKEELILRLRDLQSQQLQALNDIDGRLRKTFDDSTSINFKVVEKTTARRLTVLTDSLEVLNDRRAELIARRTFIDQLILQIDSKWTQQPLQSFLEHQLLEMARTDLIDTTGSEPRLWKFFTYLSVVIREIPEPREDLLSFIEGYMNFSSVLAPKSPLEFLASRNYSNGGVSISAQPATHEGAGDGLEKKLVELNRGDLPGSEPATKGPAKQPAADIQVRAKATRRKQEEKARQTYVSPTIAPSMTETSTTESPRSTTPSSAPPPTRAPLEPSRAASAPEAYSEN